ncbi:MAG: hypothetical protein WA047_20425 [Phenylobacterium sp.]|uniref:hypothetical protein n=1 Tax=Phenylobacterium sp. TaxID=1871053 RepID=UPI003BB70693
MSVAIAVDNTNPVRTGVAYRSGRVVQIRFTDFAQVTCRFHTMFGPSPQEAAKQMLDALGLAPVEVRVRHQLLGDVVVLRRMPADVPQHLLPGTVQPIAFIDGLTEAELASALAALAADAAFQN